MLCEICDNPGPDLGVVTFYGDAIVMCSDCSTVEPPVMGEIEALSELLAEVTR